MSKRELIDSGSSKSYYRRSDTGRYVTEGEAKSRPSTTVKETTQGATRTYRSSASGQFVPVKEGKSSSSDSVRRAYSMPNGEKIVTVRRDIVDRALGRKDKK